MKPSYSDLLRDPRWQKKRLEVLSHDKFTCAICTDSTSELHVHHAYYVAGRLPWNYPDSSYLTVCKNCHSRIKPGWQQWEHFLEFIHSDGITTGQISELLGQLAECRGENPSGELLMRTIKEAIDAYEAVH